jgi:hypothetical protein
LTDPINREKAYHVYEHIWKHYDIFLAELMESK